MYINGTATVHAAQGLNSPHRTPAAAPQSVGSSYGSDQVDISPEADLLSQVHNMPEIRADRVADLKAQIAAGGYDTDEKLSAALDGLLDELA